MFLDLIYRCSTVYLSFTFLPFHLLKIQFSWDKPLVPNAREFRVGVIILVSRLCTQFYNLSNRGTLNAVLAVISIGGFGELERSIHTIEGAYMVCKNLCTRSFLIYSGVQVNRRPHVRILRLICARVIVVDFCVHAYKLIKYVYPGIFCRSHCILTGPT